MTEDEYYKNLKEEIDEIKVLVNKIDKDKQDRIKTPTIIAVVLFILAQTGGGAWWAATMSAKLDGLKDTATTAAVNRFTSVDAVAAFELRDQRDDFLQEQIKSLIEQDRMDREAINKRLERLERKTDDK